MKGSYFLFKTRGSKSWLEVTSVAKVVYTGVSSKARKCKALYVGVNNTARKIKKGYVGVSNTARLFYASDVIYTWQKWSVNSTTNTTYSTQTVTAGIYAHMVVNRYAEIRATNISSTRISYNGLRQYSCDYTDIWKCMNNTYSGDFMHILGYERDTSASAIYTIYQLHGMQSNPSWNTDQLFFKLGNRSTPYNTNLTAYSVDIYKLVVSTSTSYSKGSTYYGTVTATNNPTAYPTNGKSGSYWYVSLIK